MKRLLGNIRTLLVLGRISNLPTVWSNILAGWLIVTDFKSAPLTLLLLGASCLYIGGMYLNDFCDAAFDAQYCKERPIPAGKIPRPLVGILAAVWFLFGLGCLIVFNPLTLGLAVLLVAAIVLYDFYHKGVAWAPVLMGTCRALLYLLAGTAAARPVTLSSWHHFILVFWYDTLAALALGCYVAGITYLARGESGPEKPARWALALLLVPLALSIGMAIAFAWLPSRLLVCWTLLLAWLAWVLVPLWWRTKPSIGRAVSGLLAGIVFVDMIAVSGGPNFSFFFFLPLFLLALLLQRIVPAT